MLTPIHSPEDAQFYLEPGEQALVPVFAFKFVRNFVALRETVLLNRQILLIPDEDNTCRLTICGNLGCVPERMLEDLKGVQGGEAAMRVYMRLVPLVMLTYALSKMERLLLYEGLLRSHYWGLIISTPKESLRVLVHKSSKTIESDRMLAWHEVPRF